MENNTENIPFSPILIMDFIRQTAVAKSLDANKPTTTTYKIKKEYYDKIANYPQQAHFIRLNHDYNENTETLSVTPEEIVLTRFKEQKSLIEIAKKCEDMYKERYKKFIEIVE